MSLLSYSQSIVVWASPESVYDMVSDVTRTGEWSPICKACWWDEGAGPHAGAWFSGRNESEGRTWETRSKVEVAIRGREFAWLMGGAFARWGFTFTPVYGRTRLIESWEFRPEGIARFQDKYGDGADAEIDKRAEEAKAGIPVTLAAIKRLAEANDPAAAPVRRASR